MPYITIDAAETKNKNQTDIFQETIFVNTSEESHVEHLAIELKSVVERMFTNGVVLEIHEDSEFNFKK